MLGVAVPEEREHSAWTEGVAIWVAVFVVSLVGEANWLELHACSCHGPDHAQHAVHQQCCDPKRLWQLPALLPSCPNPSIHSFPPSLGAFNDWNKDRQFQKLNAQKDVIEVKVVRGGHQLTIPNTEVVVGDVMLLDTGDKIVADGYTIEASPLQRRRLSKPV